MKQRVPPTSPYRNLLAGILIPLLLLPAGHRTLAATFTWSGGSANDLWSTGTNWAGTAPDNDGTAAVQFAGGTRLTPDMDANWDILSLAFNPGGGAFTLGSVGGSTLTVQGGGITNNSASTETISNAITLGAAQTWNAASGNLAFGGNVANGGFLLTVNGGSDTIVSGVISATGGLTKGGAGTLTLSGGAANTYSGVTTISAGTLDSQKVSGIGTGNVTLSGGTLKVSTVDQTYNQTFTVSSGSTIDVATGRTFTLGDAADDLTGAGALTKTGAGTLVLNQANNQSGGITISAGQINANADAALGTGTLALNGGTLFHVGNRVFANPLNVTATSGMISDNGDDVTFTSNSITGSAGVTLNFYNGVGTATSHSLILTGSGFNFASNIDLDSNSRIRMENTSGTQTFSGAITGIGYSGTGSTPPGTIARNAAGGTTIFSGANSFTGPVAVIAGTLIIQNDGALGTITSGTTVSSGADLRMQGNINVGAEALSLSGSGISAGGALRNVSGNNSYAGAVTLAADSAIASDAGTLSMTGALTNGGFVATYGGAGNVTASGVISGAGGVTKTGAGTLTMSGASANTFTGSTTVSGGTLAANGAGALGSTAKVTINTGGTVLLGTSPGNDRISNVAEVDLAGGTFHTGGFSEDVGKMTLSGNSTLDLGAGASLLTFDGTSSLGTSTLTVLNWTGVQWNSGGTDQLLFKNAPFTAGSTTSQVQFNIGGTLYNSIFLDVGSSTFELVPVPEPATIFGAGALVLALGWRERKRVARLLRSLPTRTGRGRETSRA